MEKHVRFGLLASLVLHALLIGIWRLQPPHRPIPAGGLPGERIMNVSLLHEYRGTAWVQDEVPPAPVIPVNATAERAGIVSEPAPQSGATFYLPARDPPYIPAGELDERPLPETPIIVPFPDVGLGAIKTTGVLVLYIGKDGRVDRVEVSESELPPDFERAAIDTFRQARMRPGILNGQPTRARMKILVEFEQR